MMQQCFPVLKKISDSSIALPVGPHITDDDLEYIVEHIHQTLEENL